MENKSTISWFSKVISFYVKNSELSENILDKLPYDPQTININDFKIEQHLIYNLIKSYSEQRYIVYDAAMVLYYLRKMRAYNIPDRKKLLFSFYIAQAWNYDEALNYMVWAYYFNLITKCRNFKDLYEWQILGIWFNFMDELLVFLKELDYDCNISPEECAQVLQDMAKLGEFLATTLPVSQEAKTVARGQEDVIQEAHDKLSTQNCRRLCARK